MNLRAQLTEFEKLDWGARDAHDLFTLCQQYDALCGETAMALKLMTYALEIEIGIFGEEPDSGSRLAIARNALAKAKDAGVYGE